MLIIRYFYLFTENNLKQSCQTIMKHMFYWFTKQKIYYSSEIYIIFQDAYWILSIRGGHVTLLCPKFNKKTGYFNMVANTFKLSWFKQFLFYHVLCTLEKSLKLTKNYYHGMTSCFTGAINAQFGLFCQFLRFFH